MTKYIVGIVVVAGIVIYMLGTGGSPEQTASPSPSPIVSVSPTDSPLVSVREVSVKAKNFTFEPSEIRVKKGELVKVTLVNDEGFHDFTLDVLGAKTPQIQAGQTAAVAFTANTAGTFEYYCSVGKHREQGMKGNLIVE